MLLEDIDAMAMECELDKGTEENYRRSIKFFSDWLGRPATREDLDEKLINRWLKDVGESRSRSTVRGHKASITRLWNWLASQNLVRYYDTRRLRKIRRDSPVPMPWSINNVKSLLAGAGALSGFLRNGLRASDVMRAWILLGYETGLRPKDLRLLKRSNLVDNVVVLVQNKTKVAHSIEISQSTAEAVAKLYRVDSSAIFPASRNTIRRWELRLYRVASQFGFVRIKGQGLGTLRKTAATEVCRREGIEAASRILGHVSGTDMARRHYVAPDAIGTTPQPPSLYDDRAEEALRGSLENPRGRTPKSTCDHRSREAG